MAKLLTFMIMSGLMLGSCEKSAPVKNLEKCNQTGNLFNVKGKGGTLFYTDSLPGFKFINADFYIKNSRIEGIYLPLSVCNFPQENFQSISLGDSLKVKFSGNIQLLPPTVDASSLQLELTKIELLNPMK